MSSGTAKNPTGGTGPRRVIERRSLGLISVEEVVKKDNILSAWKQVRANQGAPGIDGMSVEEFPAYAQESWKGIKQSLLQGEYHPSAVKRVEIPKDSGGTRNLGIPTVMDRVIQQAITQVLTPVFDPHFSESSFGFRPGRSAHQAVRKVHQSRCAGEESAQLGSFRILPSARISSGKQVAQLRIDLRRSHLEEPPVTVRRGIDE